MRTTVLLFLLSLLFAATSALAEDRIAVLELSGNLEPAVLRVLADEVRAGALSATRGTDVKVLTRENLASLADDMDLDLACVEGEASCEVDLGRTLGVSMLVTGTALQLDASLIVTLRMHHSSDGALLSTASVSKSTVAKTLEWLPRRAKELVLNGLGVGKDSVLLDGAVLHPQPGGLPPALLPVTREVQGRHCLADGDPWPAWIDRPDELLDGAAGIAAVGGTELEGVSLGAAYLQAASAGRQVLGEQLEAKIAVLMERLREAGSVGEAPAPRQDPGIEFASRVAAIGVKCDLSRVFVGVVVHPDPQPEASPWGWLTRLSLQLEDQLADWPAAVPQVEGLVLGLGLGPNAAEADAVALAELAFSSGQRQDCTTERSQPSARERYLGGGVRTIDTTCRHFALAPLGCPGLEGGVAQRWRDPETGVHYALAAAPRPDPAELKACAVAAEEGRDERAARLVQALDQARSTSSRARADANLQLAAERSLLVGNEVLLERTSQLSRSVTSGDTSTRHSLRLVSLPGVTSWVTDSTKEAGGGTQATEDIESIRNRLLGGHLPRAEDVKKILGRVLGGAAKPS